MGRGGKTKEGAMEEALGKGAKNRGSCSPRELSKRRLYHPDIG